MGGGQGRGNIIKYQLEHVPPIQLGFLPSKFLNIEKMLTKLFIHKNAGADPERCEGCSSTPQIWGIIFFGD